MDILYLDAGEFPGVDSLLQINSKDKERSEADYESPFAVVLHNDNLNGMDFVMNVIKQVFGFSSAKSFYLMIKTHFTGKGVLWIGAKYEAEEKQRVIQSIGPDPNMRKKGARPLTITVEPCD